MNLSLWIAMRHLRAGRRRFAAFITWTSVLGLMLGVMVLTVVVSIMNGFDGELRSRLLGSVPHVFVHMTGAEDGPELRTLVAQTPGVDRAFEFFEAAGMVTRNGMVNPVTVYGIEPDQLSVISPDRLGSSETVFEPGVLAPLAADVRGVVLGEPLARHLGLGRGDSVALVLTEPAGDSVRPRMLRFILAGTFEIGAELDWNLAIVGRQAFSREDRQRLGEDGVRVEMRDPMRAEAVAEALRARLPGTQVSTWADRFGALFQAVRLEKVLMFLVLLMVVTVAAFNIVSGQLMVVGDKRSEIAILQTMGAGQPLVRRIFLLQGLFIAALGVMSGLLLGVLVSHYINSLVGFIESVSTFRLLEGTYFVELPVDVQYADLVVIALMSLGLCVLAAWLPARRATRMNPVAALHGA